MHLAKASLLNLWELRGRSGLKICASIKYFSVTDLLLAVKENNNSRNSIFPFIGRTMGLLGGKNVFGMCP